MIRRLLNLFSSKPAAARSSRWPKVRAEHLKQEPQCRVCGTKEQLEVHHKLPVHLDASRELDPHNLITLCERNGCHFLFGHSRDWSAYNASVDADCAKARAMIARRKYE